MHKPWARKRSADEVPTPVAVAVSDFCRRAGAPAPPAEVRQALSTLAAEEDFRVRTLTDGEPPAHPLGPYAVVDVLGGTAPALAAQREACGYYQLVKAFLEAEAPLPPSDTPSPAPPGPPRAPQRSVAAPPSLASTAPPPAAPRPPTVSERIAPRRRTAGSREPSAAPPRGRFTQLASEQPTLDTLSGAELGDLLAQHGHRPALLSALGRGPSADVSSQALDRALERAGLLERAIASEREVVLSTLEEQRGALGRAAWALGVRPKEFLTWAERLGATQAVDRIRDRFRREALQPAHWTARLDLLGKRKYLEDLGVSADFERSVLADLRRALDATPGDSDERTALLATRLGVTPEALRRSLLRLGLVTRSPFVPLLPPCLNSDAHLRVHLQRMRETERRPPKTQRASPRALSCLRRGGNAEPRGEPHLLRPEGGRLGRGPLRLEEDGWRFGAGRGGSRQGAGQAWRLRGLARRQPGAGAGGLFQQRGGNTHRPDVVVQEG